MKIERKLRTLYFVTIRPVVSSVRSTSRNSEGSSGNCPAIFLTGDIQE